MTADGDLLFESDSLDITVEPGPVVKIETKSEEERIGTIIPFASGLAATMNTATGTGLRNNAAIIGFGGAGEVNVSTNQINLNGVLSHVAFPMPANGTVTTMTALISATDGGSAGVDSIVSAQLFQSVSPFSNVFDPIPGTVINFLAISGNPPPGTIREGILPNLNIKVDAGKRLLMVFYLETPGHTTGGTTITGNLCGSIMIK